MNVLTAANLLDVWERGRLQSPEQRAILLLAAAQPEQSLEQVAALSIGQRDTQLLTLREGMFGSQAISLADCPQCELRVQIDLTLNDLRVPAPDHADTWSLAIGEVEVSYRLPNSFDLITVARLAEVKAIRYALLERCLAEIMMAGQPHPISDLPLDVLDAIEEHMAQHDPQAQVQLTLTCPQCAHAWSATFDIATFFWAEINACAEQLLYQVHTFASVYGWHEADILSMSAHRRQAYLDLINV
jgi:hypothetical protein